MKKIANLEGVNVLNNKQKQKINGGQSWQCVYYVLGFKFIKNEPTTESAIANCDANTHCKGCSPVNEQ